MLSNDALLTRLELEPTRLELKDGESGQLRVRAVDLQGRRVSIPATARYLVAWSSTDSSIVQVDGTGETVTIRAVAPGSADVKVVVTPDPASISDTQLAAYELAASAEISSLQVATGLVLASPNHQSGGVGEALPSGIDVRVVDRHGNGVPGVQVRFTVKTGGGQVSAAIVPTDASGHARTSWTLGAAGGNSIEASATGIAAPLLIEATAGAAPPAVTRVVATPAADTLDAIGAVLTLSAQSYDASGSVVPGAGIRWTSLNPLIATVDSLGRLTSKGIGVALITATAVCCSASDTVMVAVQQVVASVTVTPPTPSVAVGATVQLQATLKDAQGTTVSGAAVAWSTSNANIATVGANSGLVTGVAAGNVTITATSAGKSGTSAVTVTTAQVPPSQIDTIFYEGFESGTLNAWQDGVDATLQTVVNNATLAYAGSRVLRMAIPANSDGGHLARFFMPGYDSVFVRLHVRHAANWTGNSYLALLRGSRTDDQWSSFGVAGLCPAGNDWFATNVTTVGSGSPGATQFYTYWVGMPKESDGVTCYGRFGNGNETYYPQSNLTRDQWHRVEFWVKLNTPGQNNSVQKMWIDGQLRGEWNGLNFRTTNNVKLNSLTIVGYPDSQTGQLRHIYYDEIVVTTAPIGGAYQPPTPPVPAPVATVTVSPSAPALNVGAAQQLTATLRDASGNTLTGRTVSWSSSNNAVAAVNSTGLVTAGAVGNATITATSEGKSGTASVTVSVGGGTAVPDLLSHDFENGSLGPWSNPFGSGVAVVDDPTGKLSGKVVRINYNINPGAPDHQDSNIFFEADILAQNRSHVFVRCDFVLGTPTGTDPLISRKMLYIKSPGYPEANGWAVVVGLDDLATNNRNSVSTSYGEINFHPANVNYNVQFNRRYTLELEVKRNSTTSASDGLLRVWLTNDQGVTSLVQERLNLRIATKTTEPIDLIEVGRQVDRFSSADDVAEYRYWDRCAVSTQRIGP